MEFSGWQYYSEWLYEGDSEYEYISDEGRDGAQMRFLLDADIYEYDDWDEEDPYEYFLFFLDRGTYLCESTLTEDNELNFLLLEPLHTYTNIENGFGLFGAFSMLRVK